MIICGVLCSLQLGLLLLLIHTFACCVKFLKSLSGQVAMLTSKRNMKLLAEQTIHAIEFFLDFLTSKDVKSLAYTLAIGRSVYSKDYTNIGSVISL